MSTTTNTNAPTTTTTEPLRRAVGPRLLTALVILGAGALGGGCVADAGETDLEGDSDSFDAAVIGNSTIPGTIQAEDFDIGGEGVAYHDVEAANKGGAYRTTEGVDIEATNDTGGGYDVGYIRNGEWLRYTVTAAKADTYNLDLRVSAPAAGGTITVKSGGKVVAGPIAIPATGAFSTWTTVTAKNVSLPAGKQQLVLEIGGGSFNFNFFKLTSTATGKKWHPGHYVSGAFGKYIPGTVAEATKTPYIKGFSVIHRWPDLEPTKGNYDFSAIEAELAAAKAANRQLMIQIADRTFHGEDCVPAYLKSDPIYEGGESIVTVSPTYHKCTSLRWIPAVQDRLIALYKALGARFDKEPNFEALFTQEDGVELTGSNMGKYTSAGYVAQELRGITALGQAFPHTVVFKFSSYGPGTAQIFAKAQEVGIGIGGPDLDPKSPTFATPFYAQFAGKIPLEISVQDPRSQKTITDGSTLNDMFNYAISAPNGLHVSYLIWDPAESSVLSWHNQVLPKIIATQGKVNATCPANMTCQ